MSWRTVLISTPSYLSLRHKQLVIEKTGEQVCVPVADLAFLVIEHAQVRITVPLLAQLAEEKVGVLFLGKGELPVGIYLPYANHFEPLRRYELQAKLSKPLRKRLWKSLVTAKIANQARILDSLGASHKLYTILRQTRSGDTSNREAVAARQYWGIIFDESFVRSERSDLRNMALNYGYAIIRALVSRHLAGQGYYTPLGIHHRSRFNSFNLADDLMEPLRPFVDRCVVEMIEERTLDSSELGGVLALTSSHKRALFSVLEEVALLGEDETTLLKGSEQMTESLCQAFAGSGEIHIPRVKL